MTDDDIREIEAGLDDGDDAAQDVTPDDEVVSDVPEADAEEPDVTDEPEAADVPEADEPEAADVPEADEPDAAAVSDSTEEPDAAAVSDSTEEPDELASSFWLDAEEPLPGESELERSEEEIAADEALEAVDVPEPEESTSVEEDAEAAETAAVAAAIAAEEPSLMDFGPEERDRTWIWWVLTGVAVLATIAIAIWWWVDLRVVEVPDVTGKKSANAVYAICQSGLGLGEVTEVATDTAPPGTVIEQKPAGGARVKPETEVALVLAAEPEFTRVPDVLQSKLEEAEEELAKSGLRSIVVESYDTTTVTGYVISQLPTAGVELAPGSPVALAVSKGPRPTTITVPKLEGMNTRDADQLIGSLGLIPASFRSIESSKPAGTIIAQSPTAGAAASPNDRVLYVVAEGRGTSSVVVPNVVGLKLSAADKSLKGRGLKPEYIAQSHPTVPRDQVIVQMPFAGSRMTKDGTIGVLVSTGATETVTVPTLTGLASTEVTAAIEGAGFKPVIVEVPMIGKLSGTVLGQFPAAASQWYFRFPVIALVAKP